MDYMETYAPVFNTIFVRMLVALVAVMYLEIDQIDVLTAFLDGHLDDKIYMEVPEGLKDPKRPDLVCKLLKSLYSLKQAPCQWYAEINSFLVGIGLKSSQNYHCLYTQHTLSIIYSHCSAR